jgi:flagellum-specific peptidoglycan hydrolase FlgJ
MRKFLTGLFIWITASAAAQTTATNYIEKYKDIAIKHMNNTGVPASIILGAAMHESGTGTSKIARYLNNHFGIKGRNTSKKIKSAYKGYETAELSYDDFIVVLKTHKQFNRLFAKYSDHDYQNWALGIQHGGYAADKAWSGRVLGLIKKYRLYQYDNRPAGSTESVTEDKPVETLNSSKKEITYYHVKKGDSLSAIAKKFNTTVKRLQDKNNLRTSRLKLNQKLKI